MLDDVDVSKYKLGSWAIEMNFTMKFMKVSEMQYLIN